MEPHEECDSDAEESAEADEAVETLDAWLGELDILTMGLDGKKPLSELNSPRTDTYRFSMANLQDTQDVDLDAILGELSALENQYDEAINSEQDNSGSTINAPVQTTTFVKKHKRVNSDDFQKRALAREGSPDNDSAFSDSLSLLSSESSASSGAQTHNLKRQNGGVKEEKIKLALEKMKQANVKKLFIKAFTSDGGAKSLLVDESMTIGYVTRLLAEKNHLAVDPRYGLVEHIPELSIERVYEDHEKLVDNLMLWTRDSKNKLFFVERPERTMLFQYPDLVANNSNTSSIDDTLDEFSRNNILEELLGSCGVPNVEGLLYMKSDSRKGWKRFHFVLRASGLYYYPKEKTRNPKDLVNVATFENNQVYYGIALKKKFKAPTDFCFAIKHPSLQYSKSGKYMKYLAADDQLTMHRWVLAIRIAKYGRQLLDNYKSIVEESEILSEAVHSDSGSSGCDVGFENDFPGGTIKRKPPKLPLTATTRQLKEIATMDKRLTLERAPSYSHLPPPPPELLASNTSLDTLVDIPPPPPPTRLSPPSTAFLQDLQRVMRRKWQVAQKCQEDLSTTPHEVLGFRDVPDYRETNVSNWLAEHYPTNANQSQSLYENIYRPGPVPVPVPPAVAAPSPIKKRPPPPPPPQRASTTKLTTPLSPERFHNNKCNI